MFENGECFFQQDGAPSQEKSDMKGYSDIILVSRLFLKISIIAHRPCATDLNTESFSLRRYMAPKIYSSRTATINELRSLNVWECIQMTIVMINAVCSSIRRFYEQHLGDNSQQFKHFQYLKKSTFI
ncbi:hypothetical protein AVEN_129194-1 [Araneus ventricosus]|uniref:Uncharacterized protein n=1 Tax=Araneus ventricosus TaxID=182803 RepID=A0A4Y2H5I0_ARAVE|nr:hypothetical protein AVEN_129194-1 [Araneus ventricosus]